ncbi:histidine phosphatase family protein [Marinobacter zhanjiangensis]|uniref:Histidine phosphatase family protein n=1 Tax=Marinobacter zhanjiangensis TaxID=578215 RepID=A0ABQ3AW58_9GAMM|nr:histidine phosphatase family protein [Marinobacter zhanjiangensis]GGY69676.1 histidine phosphatase family protein [Marinobacter zhanjiangensis]
MATIHLIRHGQASFGDDNYDQLSAIGWQQARVLGQWLAGKVQPDVVIGGDMQRHRETVEAIASGYRTDFPDMQVASGFNEFDHAAVVHRLKPEWADRERMQADLQTAEKPAKFFQQTFVKAVDRWASGDYDSEYPETWLQFKTRVQQALDDLVDWANGGEVFVSTSGGPIAVILQSLLGISDQKTLGLNEVIANTSVTRVLYSGRRRSLAVFNNYSHLEAEGPEMVTFR